MTMTRELTAVAFVLFARTPSPAHESTLLRMLATTASFEIHGGRAAGRGVDAMLDARVVDDEADAATRRPARCR